MLIDNANQEGEGGASPSKSPSKRKALANTASGEGVEDKKQTSYGSKYIDYFNAVIRYLPFSEFSAKGEPIGNPPDSTEIN